MKILILGGTGAMGTYLVELLSQRQDLKITVTSRRYQKSFGNITYVQGDAHDCFFVYKLLQNEFDVVIDFMVYHTDEFRARYVQFLDMCKQYVFLSSSRVYAYSKEPLTEESPRILDISQDEAYLQTDEYALSKARQEDLLRFSGRTNWTIIRPYITYSNYRLQLGVLEKEEWLYRALKGRTVVFSRDIARKLTTLTYGQDVATGIAALVGNNRALGEVFHITSTVSIRWEDVMVVYFDTLEEVLGFRPRVLLVDQSPNLRLPSARYQVVYDRLYNRVFDNSKIAQYVNVQSFTNPIGGLKSCVRRFLESPVFQDVDFGAEGRHDRLTGESVNWCEISNWKQRSKYIVFRWMPWLV